MRKASLLVLLAALLAPLRAQAQNVCAAAPLLTVRDFQTVPAENLARLAAAGAGLTIQQMNQEIQYPFENQVVRFRAVVLSDWRNSGLASINAQGIPGRIHVFVRDVNARTQGVDGMTTQIVDGTGSGLMEQFEIGDVIDVCGRVAPFGSNGTTRGMQISPVDGTSVSLAADEDPVDPSDPLMQPVVITLSDIHQTVDGPEGQNTQIRWENFNRFNVQFVRLEGAQVVQGVPNNTGRPNVLYASVGGDAVLPQYDTSLRFRNDRSATYPGRYNVRPASDPFVPPLSGTVNVQGFLGLTGTDGGFNIATPRYTNFVINPMADSDLEVLAAPPIASRPSRPQEIPGTEPFSVTSTIVPGTGQNTVASARLVYTVRRADGTTAPEASVPMTNTAGDVWSGTIPALQDGDMVRYAVEATDNEGQTGTSPASVIRVSAGDVTRIEAIQRTFDDGPGDSPLAGITTTRLNLDVVVQDVFTSGSFRYAILQDDAALAPWSGIWADVTALATPPAIGDRLNITGARIREVFSVTQLDQLTFTTTGTGAPLGYKVVPTTALAASPATAEAHEGMLLRFENVTITRRNADGPDDVAGFGEWRFSSTGSDADAVRADDLADAFEPTFNITVLGLNDVHEFMQGAWYFSFGNYKLIPTKRSDVGPVTQVSSEDVPGAEGPVRLGVAVPNPVRGQARIPYEVATAGPVSLRVYDVTGREVAVLVDGSLAPSAYEATLDVRGLAAGVYVVRLVAGDQVRTARLTVVR
ncbi:MAG: T9SS type A sorting domain-containing protein [Rubricoccaceae bacterium]